MRKIIFIFLISFAFAHTAFAQTEVEGLVVDTVAVKTEKFVLNPLAPAKAAFYSAVVPGLGQIYNKSYWKVPLVYGGMGLSIYYYAWNNNKYHEYRDAYKNRLAGREVTGELGGLDRDRLIRGQRFHQKNRDLSLLITAGLYILQIVEANVDAHLTNFNVNEDLTLRPQLQQNPTDNKHHMALSLTYQF